MKRAKSAKLKAHLATVAFIVAATALTALTTIGAAERIALATGIVANPGQAGTAASLPGAALAGAFGTTGH